MTTPITPEFTETSLDAIAAHEGVVAVFIDPEGRFDLATRRVDRLTRGAVKRVAESSAFEELGAGEAMRLDWPSGLVAEALIVVKLPRRAGTVAARTAGAAISRARAGRAALVMAGAQKRAAEVGNAIALRDYRFTARKSEPGKQPGAITVMVARPADMAAEAADLAAVTAGVFFTRDLTSEPANILTTQSFADQLAALANLGVEVEILDEAEMARLGMRALLGVGQGSVSPSKTVIMSWKGGGSDAPFALVGKGVVFDTGGISIKPAAGMEDMTMDMGGAGVVAGVMKALALRRAKANVVGLVGLVENMPDGNAQRPGDIVTSMKGDTIEVINTDAEGRLVLADVMWLAQERFKPAAMIDLATLTGAIIIGLGHENAGVFSNDDDLADAFLKAAGRVGEGAWRMPMGPAYDKLIKSEKADIKNTGGRPAASITAAQFLGRFVKNDLPWCHLDIAGVAQTTKDTALAPKGATGWGVRALDQLIRDRFEG